MCDGCLQRAANIDPRLIQLMSEIKSDYDKLIARLALVMREVTSIDILHDVGLTIEELGEERRKEVEDNISIIYGVLGIGYAVGWHTAVNSEGSSDIAMKAPLLVGMFQRGLEEGMAYCFVMNKGMH